MKILNLDWRDYHMHSITFSDWLSTIEEIVKYTWEIWLTEIAITDHSQVMVESYAQRLWIFNTWARTSLSRWKNVWNEVNVIFWVEWDLLNEAWDVCFDIQWLEPEFIILSAHSDLFDWNPENVTSATIKAIKRYHKKIKFIGHPCCNYEFWKHYDIKELVKVANEFNIPLEFNTKSLTSWYENMKKLDYLLKNANQIYINSDSHTLADLRDNRKAWLEFLKNNYWI